MNTQASDANSQGPDSEVPRPAWWLRAGGALPLPLLHAIGAALGWLLLRVLGFRRHIAADNLRRCFPELTTDERARLLARHYREWSAAALELFKLARFTPAGLRDAVALENLPAVLDALAAGRPVMLLAAHLGNWEWLGQRLSLELQVPFLVAYKPLRNAYMDRQMYALRARFGARPVPAKALPRALARLRGQPHIVSLVADQMPASSPGRVWLEFFGQPTAFYPGPAQLARRYGYDTYFLAMSRVARGRYRMRLVPLADAGQSVADDGELTRRYAAALEATLRQHPDDWAWGHRRWKTLPDAPADVRARN